MGPPRDSKQQPETKHSNNRIKTPVSISNMKRKELDCAGESEGPNSGEVVKSPKVPAKNISVFKYLNNISYGDCSNPSIKKFRKICIVNYMLEGQVCTTMCPFERRVTALEWHPKYPKFFAAASQSGELNLVNYTLQNNAGYISGVGAAGSIIGIKFSLDDECSVYTISIAGKIRQQHFYNGMSKTLLSTNSFRNWFSALDVCQDKKLILAGDTAGNVYLLTKNGEMVWAEDKSLHRDKVTHVEFCSLDPNIFVTASVDHSVNLWDLRMVSRSSSIREPSPMYNFEHLTGVNSAVFSPSNRHSLVTTDQNSELRVYKSPLWSELIIPHPHRHFQHLTPIKATWHPLEDIIVVGRFPYDHCLKNDIRTVDFLDGSTGDLLSQMKSATGGILSLNTFNRTGDCLASAAGYNIILTSRKNVSESVNFWERSNPNLFSLL